MDDATKTTLHLEGRKAEARQRFQEQLRKARERTDLTPDALASYILGIREGYESGLVDGVRLGLDVAHDEDRSFDSPEVGVA